MTALFGLLAGVADGREHIRGRFRFTSPALTCWPQLRAHGRGVGLWQLLEYLMLLSVTLQGSIWRVEGPQQTAFFGLGEAGATAHVCIVQVCGMHMVDSSGYWNT